MSSLQLPELIAAAVARVENDVPPPQRFFALMGELSALPDSVRFSQLGVRCAEYEVTLGRLDSHAVTIAALESIRSLSLAAAPTVVSLTTLNDEDREGVLVLRYAACAGERLVAGRDAQEKERGEVLGAVDNILADRCQAVERGSRVNVEEPLAKTRQDLA
jgi:hypothetical protein